MKAYKFVFATFVASVVALALSSTAKAQFNYVPIERGTPQYVPSQPVQPTYTDPYYSQPSQASEIEQVVTSVYYIEKGEIKKVRVKMLLKETQQSVLCNISEYYDNGTIPTWRKTNNTTFNNLFLTTAISRIGPSELERYLLDNFMYSTNATIGLKRVQIFFDL